jgi:hypothetical protein
MFQTQLTKPFIYYRLTQSLPYLGCELDEFQAHKFLESLGETLTVVALREKLRTIDLDCNGRSSITMKLTL